MLAAFVHFSPKDEAPQLKSSKWLIENVTVNQVDLVYMYNYRDGLWQTGKPVGVIQFKNVKATDILSAFNIIGDTLSQFHLKVKNSTFRLEPVQFIHPPHSKVRTQIHHPFSTPEILTEYCYTTLP